MQGCKSLSKKLVQYIPVVGWNAWFSDFIFLDRSYEKDKDRICKKIKELENYPDPVTV